YGRASGGRLNLRTKGGASEFRGRAFYFFRDESLNANTWKNNSLGLPRLPLQEHDPGFTLSGPVVIPKIYNRRNRTFFFTAYEFDTLLDSAVIDTLVCAAKAVAPTRFQYSRLTPAVAATGGTTSPVVLIGINDPLKLVTGTLVAGTSTSGATDRRETRLQFQEIFAYVGGNHSMK